MEPTVSRCIIDASVMLDYYRHASGADYLPEANAIVELALSRFAAVYAEFTVGHSRFRALLRKRVNLYQKLRLLSQQQADALINQLSPEQEAEVSRLMDCTVKDTELAVIRAAKAEEYVRSLTDEIGYIIRLAVLARSIGAAVILAPSRFVIAQAISRCSKEPNLKEIPGLESVAATIAGTQILFSSVLPDSKAGHSKGYSLILKGGGMKGLAYAGALQELEPYYSFDTFVGTSAGAIAAALLAVGWLPSDLETLLAGIELRQFVSLNPLNILLNLVFRGGMFNTEKLQEWVENKLRTKAGLYRNVTFKDLKFQLQIPVSTRRRGSVVFSKTSYPQSSVSFAVRCSASIPFFFTPSDWEGDIAVDGGVQDNLPIRPYVETGGDDRVLILSLISDRRRVVSRELPLLRVGRGLFGIWLDQDEDGIARIQSGSLIAIDTGPIRSTQLTLTSEERSFLLSSGRLAAVKFLRARNIQGLEIRQATLEQAVQEHLSALA